MRCRSRPIRSKIVILLALTCSIAVGLWRRSSTRPQRRPSRQMQLLSLRHQTPPRKRVSILAAQQRSYLPTSLSVHNFETGSVSIRPYELFVECWD